TVTNKDGLLTPGKWYFLVITADSSLISLYLDGSLAARALGSVLNTYNSLSPFRAGFGTLDETGNNFDGKIDEVAVFDRALASDEINSLYQTAVGFPQQKLNASQIKGQIVLDWTSGTLQVSDSITGTFTNVLQATSPYTNSIIDRSRFYRLLVH
ncbi:MAG: FecR protein, partial [Verrucomicrobiales bacterium]|nr:FecR protein [Verrucomicrobiales bacterium]